MMDGADSLWISCLPMAAQQRLQQEQGNDGKLLHPRTYNMIRADPPWAGEAADVAASNRVGGGSIGAGHS